MVQLNNNDLLIIKQSQGWASRSLSKLRSLTDKKYGRSLRDLMDRAVVIKEKSQDMWDNLATGDTISDNRAITEFNSIKILFDAIKNSIENVIVPNLKKNNIDIPAYYREQREKTSNKKTDTSTPVAGKNVSNIKEQNKEEGVEQESVSSFNKKDKQEYIDIITSFIVGIRAGGYPDELTDMANSTIVSLEHILENMKSEQISDDEFLKIFNKAKEINDKLVAQIQNIAQTQTAGTIYSALIKNASTIEETMSYYLLSLAKYGPIKTPLKSTWKNIKQYIPFAGESGDLHSFRKEAIEASKDIAKFSKEFISTIQQAISTSDNLAKWIMIIDKYNEFVDVYNSKTGSFSGMYESYILKSKLEKMEKRKKKEEEQSKKKKDKDKDKDYSDYSYSDYGFSDYDISELPSFSRSRFRKAEKIRF